MASSTTVWKGSSETPPLTLKAWDGAHEVNASIRTMPSGYRTVTDMLAAHPFYCAHRGGSDSFPEMSLYAYTQSVSLKYPAMELSLQRTSDGVYVGLHDININRTSGVTGQPNLSAMTWAQVQAFNITLGNAGPKPYMRLEQYLAAYGGKSHVTFVDPKNISSTFYPELLDLLDANGGKNKWVAKQFGSAGSWFTSAHARGYKTWGYFYQADFDAGTIPAQQAACDILGMDYTASQAAWDLVKSYGKPVMGHICPSQAAVNTALAKGADGLMVSGVLAVTR